MANGLPFSKNSFRDLKSPEAKLDALFDVIEHMYSGGYETEEDRKEKRTECEKRFKALENRKNIDRGLSAGTGFIGGFVAAIAKGLGLGS